MSWARDWVARVRPLRGHLARPYGQWARVCAAQPLGLQKVMALENALDAVLWVYSEREE